MASQLFFGTETFPLCPDPAGLMFLLSLDHAPKATFQRIPLNSNGGDRGGTVGADFCFI
jgi:hypothetical protein